MFGAAALVRYEPQKAGAFEVGLKGLQLSQNLLMNGALSALITNAGKAYGRG